MEFVGEALRRAQRNQLESRGVVALRKGGRRLPADVARVGVGDEPFGAAARRDEAMPAAVLAGLLRHEENHSAGIPGRIARIPDLANFPLPADLQRDFLHIAIADVAHRHDCHLAA